MTFPRYNRVDQIPAQDYDSYADVSFADLAKYANNCQDEDIDISKCGRDLGTAGTTSGSESNVGLIDNTGADKANNVSGSSNNRKSRVNIFAGLNALDGDEWISNKGFIRPTTDPLGGSLDWGLEATGDDFYRPTYARFNSSRVWLWAEEDTVEYPSAVTNNKNDRLMLSDNPSGFSEIGQSLGQLPFTHPLSTVPLVFAESGLDSTYISQSNVYGVPEGATFAQVSIDHSYSTGSGSYYLWVSTAYRISSTSNGDTNSFGFDGTYISGNGQWLGAFTRGVTNTTNLGNTFTSGLRGLTNKIVGLEDAFLPDDDYNSGLDNNFADFGIEMIVEVSVFT